MNLSFRKFFDVEADASGDTKAWLILGAVAVALMLFAQWLAEH